MFKSLVVFLHNPFNYYQVRHTHLTRMKYRDLKKQQWTCWLKRLNNNHTSKRGRCRNSLELDPRNSGSQHTAWQTLILFLLYFLNKCLFGCDEYNVWKLIPPHRVMTIWYPSRLQWVIGYRGPWRTQVVSSTITLVQQRLEPHLQRALLSDCVFNVKRQAVRMKGCRGRRTVQHCCYRHGFIVCQQIHVHINIRYYY